MSRSENTSLYELSYRVLPEAGPSSREAGTGRFLEDRLEIRSLSGKGLSLPFRDIVDIEPADYRIRLFLSDRDALEISQLGYHYEEFAETLISMRNALTREDLLMHEKLLYTAEELMFSHLSPEGACMTEGACSALVSETALIIAMPDARHLKFPLSYVSRLEDLDYTLVITMESGEVIRLSMLGRQREPLMLNLEKAIQQLMDHALALCREMFAGTAEHVLKRIAPFFKDGRAVRKESLDAVSPHLWQVMEGKLGPCGIAYSYEALKAQGDVSQSAIGIKRGLMGELTGEYVWLMIPLPQHSLLALEAGMTDGTGGQATYFFRIPPTSSSPDGLEQFMQLVTYCFYRINFRREPVYLTDEQLDKPAYDHYRFAIQRLPALQMLRKAFAGRILHTTEAQWHKDVNAFLEKHMK